MSSERIGTKHDSGKIDWTLLMHGCQKGLRGALRVLMHGMKVHGANNWQDVRPANRYVKALYRHLDEIAQHGFLARDRETNEFHWHHVTTNALFLAHFAESGIDPDAQGPVSVLPVDEPRAGFQRVGDGSVPVPTGIVPSRQG